ncbi:DedA family protein [Bacillus salitolerans]|uniref:DedA family protein n=1 Tax=Bacillus salitolerans TaxID=1437434 RepID=A0ABW4LL92_9BACI
MMELETAFHFVNEFGYLALFFILWIGFFGIPVPNEAIVMTTGFFVASGILEPIPALVITYIGVLMSLNTLYVFGRFFFFPIQNKLLHKPKFKQYIQKATQLIERFGPFALVVSYCFPGVRHFVPFLTGSMKMKFGTFLLYSYSTAAVWTVIFFSCGYFFGQHIDVILTHFYSIGLPILGTLFIIIFLIIRTRRKIITAKQNES